MAEGRDIEGGRRSPTERALVAAGLVIAVGLTALLIRPLGSAYCQRRPRIEACRPEVQTIPDLPLEHRDPVLGIGTNRRLADRLGFCRVIGATDLPRKGESSPAVS
jgi:hypothetical protein